MRGVAVFFTLVLVVAVLAAVSTGIYYYFRRKRYVFIPPRESSYPSSSYNPAATQTQQIHRLPPLLPSHPQSIYRPPATYAHSQATPTPAPPDNAYAVYRPSFASPYARTSNQTQPSLARTPLSSTYTQPSFTCTQPPPTRTQPSPTRTQPPPTRTQPPSTRTQTSPHPPSREHRLPTTPAGVSSNSHSNEPASARSQIAPKTPTAPPNYDDSVYRSSVVYLPIRQTQLSSNHTQPSSHVAPRVHSGSESTPPTRVQVISPDIHSEEPASVEVLDSAKKLREQARRRGREMTEARSRAKSAQKNGRRGAAQAHRQEAIAYKGAMEELDKRAAKIIFKEKNKVGLR
jgi:hypothetical protein